MPAIAKTALSHLSGPIVSVTVGSGAEAKTRALHKDLLKAKSRYFEGCLSGKFSESVNNQVTLPDMNPEAFGAFVVWAYTGKIESDDKDCKIDRASKLVRLWILSDRLMCESLQNLCMDQLRSLLFGSHPQTADLVLIVDTLNLDSVLADYYIKQMAFDMAWGWWDDIVIQHSWHT
ncbi:uncharacterized protein HMPREF1541_01725 [Cyphellophora europaea CBS 101466]|uniref:BTB domain-containing protein n=1 Tax=Cyphellophora europaea (strain CBS 101466) TaxID=1220924 RepID=W2S3F8_CYPE1|nr:uncharacterized protein HMPREF1541_01725 [Cyphellophora europaea CBS 101466]ETN42568.1 hypothetical protein HMPREF1541_01725 [Cyphellophora europaea CBS 101466]